MLCPKWHKFKKSWSNRKLKSMIAFAVVILLILIIIIAVVVIPIPIQCSKNGVKNECWNINNDNKNWYNVDKHMDMVNTWNWVMVRIRIRLIWHKNFFKYAKHLLVWLYIVIVPLQNCVIPFIHIYNPYLGNILKHDSSNSMSKTMGRRTPPPRHVVVRPTIQPWNF